MNYKTKIIMKNDFNISMCPCKLDFPSIHWYKVARWWSIIFKRRPVIGWRGFFCLMEIILQLKLFPLHRNCPSLSLTNLIIPSSCRGLAIHAW